MKNLATDLISMNLNTSNNFGNLLIKRFIWETLIHETLRQELQFHGRDDVSGFEALTNVYPDSPQLSHAYDLLSTEIYARNYCLDVKSGVYAPVSQAVQMEGLSR